MLKTRKIVKAQDNGEYGGYVGAYGQGQGNFIYGADALAQILTHQILSVRGEIRSRTDFGVDWFKKGATKNLFDTEIRQILTNNRYVKSILSFNSKLVNNNYTLTFRVDTTEGLLQISI